MKTLHELAVKLQEFIIKSQLDPHNQVNINVSRYNNLKLRMESRLYYPNIIVTLGISEATWNFRECIKTDGSLGPDEKFVRKWLSQANIIAELKDIYISVIALSRARDEQRAIAILGEADEVKKDSIPTPRKVFKNFIDKAMAAATGSENETAETSETYEEIEEEEVEENKKGLKDMLKSMYKQK